MIPLLLAALLVIPLGLDLYLPVPEENPLTTEKIELGRRLFFDRRLSRDGRSPARRATIRIAPSPTAAPSRSASLGRQGRRNSPALINRGYGRLVLLGRRLATLEEQVLKPIQDPNEMDLTLARRNAHRVDLPRDLSRLASYVRSILSGDSPFDRFINGDRTALSDEQQAGCGFSAARQIARRAMLVRTSPTSSFTTPVSPGATASSPTPAPATGLQNTNSARGGAHRSLHARRQLGTLEEWSISTMAEATKSVSRP